MDDRGASSSSRRTSEPPASGTTEGWCPSDDAIDGRKATSAEDLAFDSQAASLVVVEAQRSRPVGCAEDAILLAQVVNDVLLLPVDPAGAEQKEEGEWPRQWVHGGSLPERRPGFKTYASGLLGRDPAEFRRRHCTTGVPHNNLTDLPLAAFSHTTGSSR